jgi:hypothetical protein
VYTNLPIIPKDSTTVPIRAIVISLSKETENKVVDNETMSYE